jgi:hypothetical protein
MKLAFKASIPCVQDHHPAIVGNIALMGEWDPLCALPLYQRKDDLW